MMFYEKIRYRHPEEGYVIENFLLHDRKPLIINQINGKLVFTRIGKYIYRASFEQLTDGAVKIKCSKKLKEDKPTRYGIKSDRSYHTYHIAVVNSINNNCCAA